jgi:hypothetical protein
MEPDGVMDGKVKWRASCFSGGEPTPPAAAKAGFDNGKSMDITTMVLLTIYFASAT